jgi:hypothetical protein
MGLRDAVNKRKAAQQNGNAGKKPGLAALRAQKQAEREAARKGGLAALKKQKVQQQKKSSRLDFVIDGIRYHDAHIENIHGRPWGYVSISNGDKTYRFHNRYGSWMHPLGDGGRMAEPAAVAKHMGTNLSQLEVAQALTERFYKELKMLGIPTPEERIRQREEQARKQRRGARKDDDS